jgi:prepilin-type N-terminal cleavage/methylation domain-containing protein
MKKSKNGFTLLECLLAMVLLGLAVTGLLISNQSLTSANGAGLEITNAQFCIDQIREMTARMTAAQVAAYNNQMFSPPRDSSGTPIANLTGYSETITVQTVSAADLKTPEAGTSIYLVTVTVRLHGTDICKASWYRTVY